MIISLIAAMSKNRVIGKDNQLPWHLPADLKYFKQMTIGKPIVMGRKTFVSVGNPLPGRRNIVLTRQQHLTFDGCEVFGDMDEALEAIKDEPEVMIVGGAEIFKQALPGASRIYLTIIDNEFDGDTYFPEWNESEWQETASEAHKSDEKNPYEYRFVVFERRRD